MPTISQVPPITDEQKILVGVEPRTEGTTANPEGKPAKIDGNVQWEVMSGDVTLEAQPDVPMDGKRKIVGGTAGAYEVRAWADKDLTPDGIQNIEHSFAGVVTEAGVAELGGVTIGVPEPQ